jgi:hypothetical protein
LENCLLTADYPERINFIVSYHTKEDLCAIQKCKSFDKINTLIHVDPFNDQILFVGSANHSAAINEFARIAKSELFIVSDYDMAFVYRGWDTLLERLAFVEGKYISGTAYGNFLMPFSNQQFSNLMPWLSSAQLMKYQGLPNLSFFSTPLYLLEKIFDRCLTQFDQFLARGGIPFRIISTLEQAEATNLKLGSLQWLDTGWEIPEMIQKHHIQYEAFHYQSLADQVVMSNIEAFKKLPLLLQPEFFSLANGTPFLCHYKKGSAKTKSNNNFDFFQMFSDSIDRYLDKTTTELEATAR